MSEEERDNAKGLLKEGNKTAAQQALLRRKRYQKDLTDIYKKAALVQNIITGITNAQDNVEMVRELQQADAVLGSLNKQANPVKTDEVMMNMETKMEELDYVSERLTDSSLIESAADGDVDLGELEGELSSIMAEISEEAGIKAPATKSKVPVRTTAQTEEAVDLPAPEASKLGKEAGNDPREKEIRDEIARIKKEMESELK